MTHVGSQWLLLLKQLSKFVQVVGLEHTPVECHPLEHLTGLKSLQARQLLPFLFNKDFPLAEVNKDLEQLAEESPTRVLISQQLHI